MSNRPPATIIELNGTRLAYRDEGAGRPFVILHGAMISTGDAWNGSPVAHNDHIARMAEEFRIISVDTRGSGASIHGDRPATFDLLVDDTIALIEALNLERPILAGFSEGGATATLVALRRPDLVGALINHAGFDYFEDQTDAMIDFRTSFGGSPDATSANPEAIYALFNGNDWGSPFFARLVADYDGAQGTDYWKQYMGQLFDRTTAGVGMVLADLAAITCPTLALSGDRDFFCNPEMAARFFRAPPNAELGIVPGLGHEISPLLIEVMLTFARKQI